MEGATWLVDEVGSLQEEILNGGAARKLSEVLEGAVDEGIGLVQATVETVEEEVKRVEEDLRWWKRMFRKKKKKVAKRLERGQKRYHHSHDRLRVPLLLGTFWVIFQRVLNSKHMIPADVLQELEAEAASKRSRAQKEEEAVDGSLWDY